MISTHILDTCIGKPAASVSVILQKKGDDDHWTVLAKAITNTDGRIADFNIERQEGNYRLIFAVQSYFKKSLAQSFYTEIVICFKVDNASEHYHVPLLLNPFGYSTYRGS